jgi:transposase
VEYIGIDVGKKSLDVCVCGHVKRFANTENGILELIQEVEKLNKEYEVYLIVEASGGYEKPLVNSCYAHSIQIHVAHANKVRSYAKSKGILAKTDQIDAAIITEYGSVMAIQPTQLRLNGVEAGIRDLLIRREQLMLDMARDKNRMDKIYNPCIKTSITSHIEWLKEEIEKMDKELYRLTRIEGTSEKHDLLTSVPSVGSLTACQLIANLPELGTLSHKQLAALVGVAPYNRQSGNHDGKRYIQGGRGNVRKSLYMSAISSIRCNPDMKAFYEHLILAGKPTKVAIVAVMRKLLCVLNSIVMRGSPWENKLCVQS